MTPVVRLAWLTASLALVATLVGLLGPDGAGPAAVESVRGERVELYGEGFYWRDSVFKGASNVGTDVVTLAVGIPLLMFATLRHRRGVPGSGLLLAGAFTWFAYVYATYALSVAFNALFLVYVALFSASLFALVLLARGTDAVPVAARVPDRVRRSTAALLLAGGAVTAVVWGLPLLDALLSNTAPRWMDTQSTMVTDALDLAIITPSALLAGSLLRRGEPFGYVLAVPLLVLLLVLAPAIVAQTVSQLDAGLDFTAGEVIGPIAGFLVLAVFAARSLAGILRS